jgi:hypothetical protein
MKTSIPLTPNFVALIQALQAAKAHFLYETMLAISSGRPEPEHYLVRCHDLYMNRYAQYLADIGLPKNEHILLS